MKALTTFIAIALLAFSTTACSQQHTYRSGGFGSKTVKASKNYVTKDIKVDNFTKLSVAGSPDVTYTQKSGKPTVEVYTSDNIVDLLDIRVKDNTLYIGIIRKTKCFDFWERNVLFPKTKRSFFRTPKHPLPCPFPLNFSLLIITKKFGNLAKNRYICIV